MKIITPVLDAARSAEQQVEATATALRDTVTDGVEQQVQLAKGLVEIVQNAALDLYGSAATAAEKVAADATSGFEHLVKKGEALHLGSRAEDLADEAEADAAAAAEAASERFGEAMTAFETARSAFQERLDAVLAESMRKAGLPTRSDVAALKSSVDALNERVSSLAAQ